MKAKVIKTGEIVDIYHESQHGQITNIYKESVLVNGRMWTEDELDFCMEANRAPEKIYLEREKETDKIHHLWGRTPVISSLYEHIEYTRTDAFIEKACEWIKEKWDNNYTMPIIIDSVIDEFKNYMEGE